MSLNIEQIYTANPATTVESNDLFYLGRSPYGTSDDFAITGANLTAGLISGAVLLAPSGPQTIVGDFALNSTGLVNAEAGLTANGGPINISTDTETTTVNIGTGATGIKTINIGNNNAANIVTLGSNIGSASTTINTGTTPLVMTGVYGVSPSTPEMMTISPAGVVGSQAIAAVVTPSALTEANDTNVTLTLSGTPATALLQAVEITAGWTGTLSGTRGGTGVNNGASTLTLGGSLITSGAFASTFIMTAPTTVTFPTSGTLATTTQLPTPAALTEVNDTNVTLTLGGTPSTALLEATSITAGWTGTLSPTRGGTGVNNGTSTLTLAGNLATSGAFGSTFTMTGTTSVTFPTSGTLATTSQIPSVVPAALTETNDTNVTLTLGGTPATALLQATSITAGWTGQLSGTRGGTGVNNGTSTFTYGGNTSFVGAFTFAGTLTGNTAVTFPTSGTLATTSQLPTPAALTESNDTNVTLTLSGTPATALLEAVEITAGWTGTLAVGRGGLGIATTPTNGEIPIGNGTDYTAATLTAGTGISITNGSGNITVACTGAVPWVDETGSSVTMTTNTGYTADDGATLVTFTLPTTSAIGDFVEINGKGSGGWIIAQAAGQQIHFGSSTTTSGTGGSLASTLQYDNVRLRCLTANTIFTVVSVQGTLTVV